MTSPGLETTILKFHDFSRFSMSVRTPSLTHAVPRGSSCARPGLPARLHSSQKQVVRRPRVHGIPLRVSSGRFYGPSPWTECDARTQLDVQVEARGHLLGLGSYRECRGNVIFNPKSRERWETEATGSRRIQAIELSPLQGLRESKPRVQQTENLQETDFPPGQSSQIFLQRP